MNQDCYITVSESSRIKREQRKHSVNAINILAIAAVRYTASMVMEEQDTKILWDFNNRTDSVIETRS